MRDYTRIERVLNTIKRIWEKNPDLRLCQLILNLTTNGDMLYWVEDDKLEQALIEMYENSGN
jgi:uncharacterized protein YihD (DUF1040 family)